MENRVRFKIGEVEFEAEGNADVIERERTAFLSAILPTAIDAISRSLEDKRAMQYIEVDNESVSQLSVVSDATYSEKQTFQSPNDLSRTSLASFTTKYGKLPDQDFVLFAAYFDEKRSDVRSFSSVTVKHLYEEARRTKCANISDVLQRLAKKGLIMDDPDAEKGKAKQYILTDDGVKYVENYQPKTEGTEKSRSIKPRKQKSKFVSEYSSLNRDELNLHQYPKITDLKNFREKMMMVLHICTQEGKIEWFKVYDVMHLMSEVFGEAATIDQINGIFKRERTWFKIEDVEGNNKEKKRKLLNEGITFARNLIPATENP